MQTITRPGTPLRHRMLDDMRMRKFAERTQDSYIRAVRKLAAFLADRPTPRPLKIFDASNCTW